MVYGKIIITAYDESVEVPESVYLYKKYPDGSEDFLFLEFNNTQTKIDKLTT